ncbi:bifunctional diaminohydroxyphosphoribosylaminopyrimidine deaminase/5-amino-6-(5-phosphoribosylamino)uracil reductase RibD [Desulfoluna spongiiphila]|uniref:bifunctional diaminohydroxyphosphoribosylaminopyrimidine deaminase/5-amino-6-(5-phosphoribosylamino)uracil reductase RibD n=1 Tax=Desulfoluna spongiiphila TaxID=419481 RepID=UPI0012514476|nr:bifunctional diaminohydroxyphosphoribosylaminopyrimidine deaminase/5-amino-6-(5-phosphoribosylamino)uracil reductase RibD [Desulfoluna spongiiphila]VVS92848.1 riboflavin biosynthesis protein ribd [Desulfoluna spongiiphila]
MEAQEYMEMALALAARGIGWTSPNPAVGAVVVNNGRVVGRGWHKACGGPHAEVFAIDEAGDRAEGGDIYVTLEPCNHTGKTPPCTEKILNAGIRRVFIAMEDPNPVASGGIARLRSQGVEVTCGILREKALAINEGFIKHVQTGLPFVIAKSAATLDGRTAASTGHSQWITGEKSRRHVHELRHAVDAILVGIGTVKADNPSLTCRLESGGKDPVRIVLDSRLTIDEQAKVLQLKSDSDTIIVCGKIPPEKSETAQKKARLTAAGARVLEVPLKDNHVDLDRLMAILGEEKIQSILLEGGATLLKSAMDAKIVDKFRIYIAPKLLTGDDGFPVTAGRGPLSMDEALTLSRVAVRHFDNDVMIEGYL